VEIDSKVSIISASMLGNVRLCEDPANDNEPESIEAILTSPSRFFPMNQLREFQFSPSTFRSLDCISEKANAAEAVHEDLCFTKHFQATFVILQRFLSSTVMSLRTWSHGISPLLFCFCFRQITFNAVPDIL
jgi:hypothetical protein